jgi:hypothetical protein
LNGGNSGEFTCYVFGSPAEGACGYSVTQSGSPSNANLCQGAVTEDVPNIALSGLAKSSYYVAIPGNNTPNSGGFNTVVDCGACIEISNGGNTIIATVIDECPGPGNAPCMQNPNGELDLSYPAFQALNFGNTGNPQNTSWHFVACPIPVTSPIVAKVNSAGQQYYFQNSVYPISTVNGQGPSQFGYFSVTPGPVTIVSNVANQTLHGTLSSAGGGVGVQFTGPTTCP